MHYFQLNEILKYLFRYVKLLYKNYIFILVIVRSM